MIPVQMLVLKLVKVRHRLMTHTRRISVTWQSHPTRVKTKRQYSVRIYEFPIRWASILMLCLYVTDQSSSSGTGTAQHTADQRRSLQPTTKPIVSIQYPSIYFIFYSLDVNLNAQLFVVDNSSEAYHTSDQGSSAVLWPSRGSGLSTRMWNKIGNIGKNVKIEKIGFCISLSLNNGVGFCQGALSLFCQTLLYYAIMTKVSVCMITQYFDEF